MTQIQPQLITLMEHNKNIRIVCSIWGLKGLLPTKATEYMKQNESATISLDALDSIRNLSEISKSQKNAKHKKKRLCHSQFL